MCQLGNKVFSTAEVTKLVSEGTVYLEYERGQRELVLSLADGGQRKTLQTIDNVPEADVVMFAARYGFREDLNNAILRIWYRYDISALSC